MMVGAHFLANVSYRQTPVPLLCLLIQVLGFTCFAYIVAKRLAPLLRAQRDFRTDRLWLRLEKILKFWLAQWKQPRFPLAGILHITIFAGFLILMYRSASLVVLGFTGHFSSPEMAGGGARLYNLVKDYAATLVFLSALVAAIRRDCIQAIALRRASAIRPRPYMGSDHCSRTDRHSDDLRKHFRGQRSPLDAGEWKSRSAGGSAFARLGGGKAFAHGATCMAVSDSRVLVSASRRHLLRIPLFLTSGKALSRRHLFVQRRFRQGGPWHREAGSLGRERRPIGPGEIVRGENVSRTSPGSICWISTPAPTAGDAPTTVPRTRSGGLSRHGSSPSRHEITASSTIPCSAVRTTGRR